MSIDLNLRDHIKIRPTAIAAITPGMLIFQRISWVPTAPEWLVAVEELAVAVEVWDTDPPVEAEPEALGDTVLELVIPHSWANSMTPAPS